MDPKLQAVHEKLKEIRARNDLSLKVPPLLKETFTDFDGTEKPLKLRAYQVQAVLHLNVMSRFVLGDDTGLGKTLCTISALCCVWKNTPDTKVVILTNKSVLSQWASEFDKFCVPNEISIFIASGTAAAREKVYKNFQGSTGPTVLLLGYATLRRDIRLVQDWSGHILVSDECTAFKTPGSQVHQCVRHLGDPSRATRHWGLTATLIKNNLVEGFGIYSVVVPGLFPSTKNKFMQEYCITKLQPIPKSNRKVPVIVGYAPQHIQKFREKIDPYFISRAKGDVAKELPILTIKEHKVGMTPEQKAKYKEALDGLLTLDKVGEEKETTSLTALIYCQQIVDHLEIIGCDGESAKMDALFDLLTEGEFEDEKIIVFSRFRKMIDVLEREAKERFKMKTVRITGAEKTEEERKAAMKAFQTPNNDIRICWITMAAAEGINLQAAKAIVFYDSPWSYGDYLQVIGRMIRIGSLHDRCYAIHMVTRASIDMHVMDVLRKKTILVESILGKRIKGEGDANAIITDENNIQDLFERMLQDARQGL